MIVPFKNRVISPIKVVEVYRNLHNNMFSIKQGGLVVAHGDNFFAKNVRAKISESGRQRVLQEKRKSVHAVLVCEEVFTQPYNNTDIDSLSDLFPELYYEPYTLDSFINKETGEKIYRCDTVYFKNGKVYILSK